MIKNLLNPLVVSIANKSDKNEYFVPYRENQCFLVQPKGKVSFTINNAGEALYYENQHNKNLVTAVAQQGKGNVETGTYDESASTFTKAASYNIILESSSIETIDNATTETYNYNVIGEIPYTAASSILGLAAGNRFTVRFYNETIESLPNGTIATLAVSNGTTNTYTKSAFEEDNSLIGVVKINKNSIITTTIKWSDSLTSVYVFKFIDADLVSDGTAVKDIQDMNITLPAKITLTNDTTKDIAFIPYKENFNVMLKSNDSIIMDSNINNEVLYYILQANKNIKVSVQ